MSPCNPSVQPSLPRHVAVRKKCQGCFVFFFQVWLFFIAIKSLFFCVERWSTSLYAFSVTPLLHLPTSLRLSYLTVKAEFFIFSIFFFKKALKRSWPFFACQRMGSLSKHTWLTNDNLSLDLSRNLVSQNAVLGERSDRVGEDGNDRKRRANTALCYSVCIPQACDKVKLSPPGWHASRRHFEVNTSQGMWLWDLDSGLTRRLEASFSLI